MQRLFAKSKYSVNDLATKENAIIFGGVLAACALAAYSFPMFFVVAAITMFVIAANEIMKNHNSIVNQFSRFLGI